MSLHRFYAPPEQTRGPVIRLGGTEAHHALHVLRVRRGDQIVVLDGSGKEIKCKVLEASRTEVSLEAESSHVQAQPDCAITLFQAIPKGKTIESIIQKATELGVARIVPLITEHVVARPDANEFAKKAAKWQGVAIEAIKQCGQAWLPKVSEPAFLPDVLRANRGLDLELVGALSGESHHPHDWFHAFRTQHGKAPASVGIWIGPEGDFAPNELEMIIAAGARPISLGPLVLRCETAAIYTISITRHETTAA